MPLPPCYKVTGNVIMFVSVVHSTLYYVLMMSWEIPLKSILLFNLTQEAEHVCTK